MENNNKIQTITKKNEVIIVSQVYCKNCGSNNVVKKGIYKGVQRYFCKECKRKFKGDTDLFHMKTPSEQISSALMMYYSGSSVKDIKNFLRQEYHNEPSKSTIFAWIDKYTDEALKITKDYHPPKVGDVWVADETVLRIGGQNVWMYDIIDEKTRYLLATRIALSRTSHDAEMLMKEASKLAGKVPRKVITDSNSSYPDGIEMAFGADAEHIQSYPFAKENDTQKIERWHETLKERTKIMKGLKSIDSAMSFIDGFLVHYNYFRPHEALDGKTPAEEAGIKFPYKNWAEIIRQPVSKEAEIKSHKTPHIRIIKERVKLPTTHVGRPRTHIRKPKSKEIDLGAGIVISHGKRHLRLN